MAGIGPNPSNGNLLLVTDSYKVTHHLQYPPGAETVYSYFESRGGKFKETVFFGLQYIIKRWLLGQVITKEKLEEAAEIYDAHLGPGLFNYEGWKYILEKHGGRLPIRIMAVPEGTVVPYKNVLFTVENTDPKCFWLTNYVETLLVQVWYPMTVCTNSRAQKEIIAKFLDETADNLDGLPLKLHDFGMRGSTSVESAAIGDAAHLVNFQGTDAIGGLVCARDYYGCKMAGFSIPAAEHSTITSWTREGEVAAYRNMLEKFPDGVVACVSDSYNIWEACEKIWGEELKSMVEDRGKRGVGPLVVRPDSGDPPTVVVKVLDILGSKFGTLTNSKGYKMLPPYIRVIQGDGISYESLQDILENMKKNKWSADNLTFGSGGALLQRLDRDTQKCAYKCSHAVINGKGVNIYKEPVTDPGKISKKGRMTLELDGEGHYVTKTEGRGDPSKDQMVLVYENGSLLRDYSFEEVRDRAELPLVKLRRKEKASDLSFYPPLLFLHGCKIKAEVGGLDDTRLTHTYTEEGETKRMTCYFVIVGHNDNPLFEMDFPPRTQEGTKTDDKRHLNQFVAHAALDLVDEAKWQTGNLYLKTVDRFNDLTVTGFVTASQMRFLLVHDSIRTAENLKSFFQEIYELFVRALLNPFYTPNTPITSSNFRKKAQVVAKKYLHS